MSNGKPGDTLPGDANHPVDKNSEAGFVKSVTPFVVVGLCLIAFLTNGGVIAAALVVVAFFVGWSVASGRLPFGRTLEQRRERGRTVLRALDESRVRDLLAATESNRKIDAIKMIRSEPHFSLADAKEAVDLLADLGLHWSDTREISH